MLLNARLIPQYSFVYGVKPRGKGKIPFPRREFVLCSKRAALQGTEKAMEPTFHFLLHWSCSCAASARCWLEGSVPLQVASVLLTFFVVFLFLPAGNLSFPVVWKEESRKKPMKQRTNGLYLVVLQHLF